MTNVAFDAFSCYTFLIGDGSTHEYLKADVEVRCGSAEHERITAVAWIAIALYPIGLLALYAALLFTAHKDILRRRSTLLTSSIAFLYQEYEPHFFCTRRPRPKEHACRNPAKSRTAAARCRPSAAPPFNCPSFQPPRVAASGDRLRQRCPALH